MKKKFLNYCINLIDENQNNISKEKLEEIKYGLESLYLTISKTVVIFSLAIILGIFKEMLLMLFFFNILRTTGFGLHAKKSWMCWVSSLTTFILLPFLSRLFVLNNNLKLIIGIFCIIQIYMYAPADTIKHPLINKKKRIIWKWLSTINCIILVSISIFLDSYIISNLILFAIIIEIILIHPITYKIFHLSYDNYKNYNYSC